MMTVNGTEMHGVGRGEPSGEADLAIRVPAFTRCMGFSGDFRCHPHHPPPIGAHPEGPDDARRGCESREQGETMVNMKLLTPLDMHGQRCG